MLVDNSSCVNIIFQTTFAKMIVDPELIFIYTNPIIRFIGDRIIPREKITFAVNMGELPQTALNLCMKFPTPHGIATIRSDKMGAHECYLNSTRKAKPRDVSMVVMDVDIVDALEE